LFQEIALDTSNNIISLNSYNLT